MKKWFLSATLFICVQLTRSQTENTTDSLTPERKWWNVLHYAISITPDYNRQFISGKNVINFIALQNGKEMQIDLQKPMSIKEWGKRQQNNFNYYETN